MKEWRVKAPVSSPSTAQSPNDAESRGEDGFQIVTRHNTRHIMPRREEHTDLIELTNTYNVLKEGAEPQVMVGNRGRVTEPYMDKKISWNIRGMNAPNKQEDIKVFLQQERPGIVGFLETKVKETNIQHVMSKVCTN